MKTSTTKYLSCAETAKLVRVALKAKFPRTKFSVRSHTYSGGASIDIRYQNGPTTHEVDEVCELYEGASFDGMQDLKSYHSSILTDTEGNSEKVQFGVDYVIPSRDYSPEFNSELCNEIDLRDGKPTLKAQFKNLLKKYRSFPCLDSSMLISADEKTCRIYSKQKFNAQDEVKKALELQGYRVNLYQENGRQVFEAIEQN